MERITNHPEPVFLARDRAKTSAPMNAKLRKCQARARPSRVSVHALDRSVHRWFRSVRCSLAEHSRRRSDGAIP
jgi:hypothetical protein